MVDQESMGEALPEETRDDVVDLLKEMGSSFVMVGTIAPKGGSFGLYLGLLAADLIIGEKDVKLLSPDSSSAADRTIPRGIGFFAVMGMLALKNDNLILALEPNLPFSPTAKKLQRALTLNLMALLLKRFKHTVLICDTPIQIPGGIGGRTAKSFWTSFDYVILQNQDNLSQIKELPYIADNKIIIAGLQTGEETEDLSGDAYDADILGTLPVEQVAYVLHLRARRAGAMTQAAADMSRDYNPAASKKDLSVGFGIARYKSIFSSALYILKRIYRMKYDSAIKK